MFAPNMLSAALDLAARGWLVFPVRGKIPAIRGGKGCLDATTNAVTIRAWWRKFHDAGIGVATGKASRLVVLDLDSPASRTAYLRKFGPRALDTLTSRTARGWHALFNCPEFPVGNSTSRLGQGVDIRGEGGYFVAPPSLHPSGHRYTWMSDRPVAALPASVTDAIRHLSRSLSNPSISPSYLPQRGSLAENLRRARAYLDKIPSLREAEGRNQKAFPCYRFCCLENSGGNSGKHLGRHR